MSETRIVTVLSERDLENMREGRAVREEIATRIAREIANRLVITVEVTMNQEDA